jgi:hypothetical protein
MAVGAPLAQRSGFVFGLLTLAANETKPLSGAAFSAVAAAPNACSGIVVKLRSGEARLVDKATGATDGWTLVAGQAFGDVTGSDLSTIYIQETAGAPATIEVLCRTGRIS